MFQSLILVLIFMIVFLIFVCQYIKKRDSFIEKLLDVLIIVILFTPIIIYYLDYFNIFILIKLNENVNTQNWLSFLASYLSSTIGAFFYI